LLIGKNPEAPSGKSGSALAKLLPMLRKK